MRASLAVGTCLVLLTTLLGSAEIPERTLDEPTDLMSGPDGIRVAVLLPGARIRIMEQRTGWDRVAIEGWVRSDESLPATGLAEPAPATPAPDTAVAARGTISGAVFITDPKGRTTIGAGLALRLLSNPQGAAAKVAVIVAECEASTAGLKAEADALKAKGSRAMKTIENPSMAFEAYDEAKRQRADKLREIKKLDEECGRRVESEVDAHTVQRTLSDAQGRFVFDSVPAGRYSLHGLLEAADVRHVWDVELVVEPGARLILDLTNANRTRTTAVPDYR